MDEDLGHIFPLHRLPNGQFWGQDLVSDQGEFTLQLASATLQIKLFTKQVLAPLL